MTDAKLACSKMPKLTTFSREHIRRHRDTHIKFAQFGTHAHPYLHGAIRTLVQAISAREGRLPSLLDYGCGKGSFLREMDRLLLFSSTTGYDPAVDAYLSRPTGIFDVVTCLDVLDQTESGYVDAIIRDVARLTRTAAIFSLISKQRERRPETQPVVFRQAVERHFTVSQMSLRRSTPLELSQGAAIERAVIVAEPAIQPKPV